MKKLWKPIKNSRGKYLISNYGDVYSKYCNRLLSKYANDYGTLFVYLYLNNKGINKPIHRLVLKHFKKKERLKDYGLHIDYDRKNNKATNLKWASLGDIRRHHNVRKNKVRGVYRWNIGNKKYRVAIKFKTKLKTIGYYKTKNEAVNAYMINYKKFYGVIPYETSK